MGFLAVMTIILGFFGLESERPCSLSLPYRLKMRQHPAVGFGFDDSTKTSSMVLVKSRDSPTYICSRMYIIMYMTRLNIQKWPRNRTTAVCP